jgi:peptidoglycan LD-endopeptidase CwlK
VISKIKVGVLLFFSTVCFSVSSIDRFQALQKLKDSYPDCIQEVFEDYIVWVDGQVMDIENSDVSKSVIEKIKNPSLADQLEQDPYIVGKPESDPENDSGRIRFEPFFRKMYGNSPEEVEANLETVAWMPKVLGENARMLRVTRVHSIHEKIQKISKELEELVFQYPEYIKFVDRPGGTYCWRVIAGTNRLSNHSFGMTIDINVSQSHYWQWDLKKEGRAVCEHAELVYRNAIPWEIVAIFEKHGFIWGGKWYHYDTMHFEYRPELLVDPQTINPEV